MHCVTRLFDLVLPLYAVIGYRSYLIENSTDPARHFAEPILRAWGPDYILLTKPAELERLRDHILARRAAGKRVSRSWPRGHSDRLFSPRPRPRCAAGRGEIMRRESSQTMPAPASRPRERS